MVCLTINVQHITYMTLCITYIGRYQSDVLAVLLNRFGAIARVSCGFLSVLSTNDPALHVLLISYKLTLNFEVIN